MLIIRRKIGEKIIIGHEAGDIEITVEKTARNRARFAIKAPKHIPIRSEVIRPKKAVPPGEWFDKDRNRQ